MTCTRPAFGYSMLALAALALFAPPAALAEAPAAPVDAGQGHLALTAQGVETDEGGAFVSVSVKNGTPTEQNEIIVSCVFLAGERSLGSASTPIYATPPGETGYGQVRLLGATSATSAACKITSAE